MTQFIKHIETGTTVSVKEDLDAMSKELAAVGVKIGKTSLKQLISKARPNISGCILLEGEIVPVGTAPAGDAAGGEVAGGTAPAGDAGAGDEGAEPSRALKPHEVGAGAPATNLTPEPAPAAAKTTRARAVIKASEPKGKVKPVRKGTKIANGMELLLKGATIAELEAAAAVDTIGDDVVDFCNRRVTKRGYGIKLDQGKVWLVAPGDVIQYTASAADEKEDTKPAATAAPAPEVAAPAPAPAGDAPQS